jgi:hypothetical protein
VEEDTAAARGAENTGGLGTEGAPVCLGVLGL